MAHVSDAAVRGHSLLNRRASTAYAEFAAPAPRSGSHKDDHKVDGPSEADRERSIKFIWEKFESHINPPIPVKDGSEMLAALRNPENLAAFAKVTELDLSSFAAFNLNFRCLPIELFELPLASLKLIGPEALVIPDELCKLDKLKVLIARGLSLQALPKGIALLPRLEHLDLRFNLLTKKACKAVARALTDIPSLKSVLFDTERGEKDVAFANERAKSNALVRVWKELGDFIGGNEAWQKAVESNSLLREIYSNPQPRPSQLRSFFNTCFKERIYCFDSILKLDLNGLDLTTIPAELRCLRKVQVITLSNNRVSDETIPLDPQEILAQFQELVVLDLRGNDIPAEENAEIRKKLLTICKKLKTIHFPKDDPVPQRNQSRSIACIVM